MSGPISLAAFVCGPALCLHATRAAQRKLCVPARIIGSSKIKTGEEHVRTVSRDENSLGIVLRKTVTIRSEFSHIYKIIKSNTVKIDYKINLK